MLSFCTYSRLICKNCLCQYHSILESLSRLSNASQRYPYIGFVVYGQYIYILELTRISEAAYMFHVWKIAFWNESLWNLVYSKSIKAITTIMLRFLTICMISEHRSKEYQTSTKMYVTKIKYSISVIICNEHNKMVLDKIIKSLQNIFINDCSVFWLHCLAHKLSSYTILILFPVYND